MATVLGAGTALAATWLLDPAFVASAQTQGPPPQPELVDATPVDPTGTLDLLARVVWLLGSEAHGLGLTELRALLSEPADSLQRALAAGLRTKRLRRVGAHNKLRYLLNT